MNTSIDHIKESNGPRELCDQCKINKKNNCFRLETTNPYHHIGSSIYYFCCVNCRDTYESEKMCKHCHYDYYPNSNRKRMENRDGAMFCVDNRDCRKFPVNISCYQQYTGIYTCHYCENERSVHEEVCYRMRDEYEEIIFVCSKCMEHFTHDGLIKHGKYDRDCIEMNGWRDIYDRDNDGLLKVLKKNPQFICNKCDKISNVSNGIRIVDKMNVCSDCVLHCYLDHDGCKKLSRSK